MPGRTLLTLILFATALSGCLDRGSGDAHAEPLDAADAEPVPGERLAAVEAGNLTPAPTPFSWTGQVPYRAVACATDCVGHDLTAWENTHPLADVTGGHLNVTWDTPNELVLGVATGCEEACTFVERSDEGTSPLSMQLSGLDPDQAYTLVVLHPYDGEGAGFHVGIETEFHVEGTLLTV